MGCVNKATIIGFLGSDPDVRITPGGTTIANFSVATTEKWKDRDGKQQEKTMWHRIACFGKLAELARDYLKKGQQVYLEGALQTREWEKDGVKRYTTEIKATQIVFLGKADGEPKRERQQHDPGAYVPRDAEPPQYPDDQDLPF